MRTLDRFVPTLFACSMVLAAILVGMSPATASKGSAGAFYFQASIPTNSAYADTSLQNAVVVSPSANYVSGVQANNNWRGAVFTLTVASAASGQTAQLQILGVDPTSTNTYVVMQSSALGNGRYIFNLYPGANASGSATDPTSGATTTVSSLSAPLPKTFKVQVVYADLTGTKSITQTVAYSGVL